MVAKLLPPESASVEDVAQETRVNVLTTAALDETSRSAWHHENGVYPQELAAWRDTATQALAGPAERACHAWANDGGSKNSSAKFGAKTVRWPNRSVRMLAIANEPRFADMPPARIVPALADEGVYLASESTFYRLLRAQGQNAHRGRAKAPQASREPSTHIASAVRQVWCWNMTYLPATVADTWSYLYLIMDIYSRKIIAWEVHGTDDADHAVRFVQRAAGRKDCR